MASKDKFEDLDLTESEIKRLGEALKDEKFRKLFVEYAQEISDPENKRRYEEEIAQLERERGMDVSFVHPEPGYVMKTSVNGDSKIFINICKNDKIGKPTATRKEGPDGRSGVQWSIPHSFAPPRDDLDKSGKKCRVFDVVFHPDTYRMAETNERFRKLVNDTALDGIETQYGLKLDRKNVKRPKLAYKGVPTATVIRSRTSDSAKPKKGGGSLENFPYPYSSKTSEELAKEKAEEIKKKEDAKRKEEEKSRKNHTGSSGEGPTEPKFVITHRSDMDLQEYRNAPDSKTSTRPKELVVAIDLPLLNSAASVGLDIFERRLVLESVKPAAYKLDLKLPYPVDDSRGSAKFDKAKHRLTVTLPVIPADVPDLPSYIEDCAGTLDEMGEEKMPDPTSFTNGHDNTESKPLIEVLSSSTSLCPDTKTEMLNDVIPNQPVGEAEKDIWVQEPSYNTPVRKVFTFPSYSHRQDNETVSFVLDVKRVGFDTVTKLFPASCCFQVRFASVGSGCFPMHYSFYLRFPEGCNVVPDHCSVDVSHQNVVLLILKGRESRGLWQKFWVGQDENHLEEKLFATEDNLELELGQLEKEALANEKMVQSENQQDQAPEVKVTEMSEKALKISLGLPKKTKGTLPSEDEGIEDTDLTSPDIQVICERQGRQLHSILKQRSRSHSESSDDLQSGGSYSRENSTSSGSQLSESPISESEEIEGHHDSHLKKSVSFSEHVDRATFKPGGTVCSMKTALKSKRRRNRKREEKKRRRNNSGSEYSSSDEHPHGHDTEDEKGEEEGEVLGDENITKPSSKKGQKDCKSKTNPQTKVQGKKTGVKSVKAKGQADDKVVSLDETYRTSNNTTEQSNDSDKCALQDAAVSNDGAVSQGRSQNRGEDSDDDASPPSEDLAHNDLATPKGSGISCEQALGCDTNKSTATSEQVEQSIDALSDQADIVSSKTSNIGSTSKLDSDPPSPASTQSVGGTAEPPISWEEREGAQLEHKTQCAFTFSNSVMFDLDVD